MTARATESNTADLFGGPISAADLESPAMDLKVRIARAMATALKHCAEDRYEIAARMSRILAPREVTKNMLDAYAAASKDTHIPNLTFCIAFDDATGQHELLNLYAALRGCRVLVGDEAIRAEIVRLEMQEEELRKKRRRLKTFITKRGHR